MSRNKLIVGGIILLVVLGLIVTVVVKLARGSGHSTTSQRIPISGLAYCGNDSQTKPCIVSFGTDADDNMLVNILVPSLSFPSFYLKIERANQNSESDYECFRVRSSLNSAYCVGEKMPPGETLHLMIISTKDETLLAEGDLSIIALAFATVEVVTPTLGPTEAPAASAPTESSTEAPDFVLPTLTPLPLSTSTEPSYPPSYP